MTIPKNVAEILQNRVTLEVESIDRMYLNGYIPLLQSEGGAAYFIRTHLGKPFASTAAVAPMTKEFVKNIEMFAKDQGIEIVPFQKKQSKDELMKERLASFKPTEGVVFIGKAQEKASLFRTMRRRNPETGQAYPWLFRSTAMPNHFYFYILDEDFGPLFIKFCSYFPYTIKVCINGHEWLKRQLAKAGISFIALDNGILSCDQPERLQALCDQFNSQKIEAVFRKWLARLPHPIHPEHQEVGYRYQLSIIQAEFSLTQVLDAPRTGRQFFEEIIRENIDLGRPEWVQLIFGKRITRRTPSLFRTRVITRDVTPSLNVYYKSSKIKQYHKEGRALRTETTINNTRDFQIGRRLKNLEQLRQVGFKANRRLLDVQTLSHDCTIGEERFLSLVRPSNINGRKASSLSFGDSRVLAMMQVLCLFAILPDGFQNRDFRKFMSHLLGVAPDNYSRGQATYDLRRLRCNGLIERRNGSNRYTVRADGIQAALFFTRAQARFFRVAFADPLCLSTKPRTAVIKNFHKAKIAVDQLIEAAKLAA